MKSNKQFYIPLTDEILSTLEQEGIIWPEGSGSFFEIEEYLKYLPDLEAEIVYLVFIKRKTQNDVGEILKISQPTVSYRFKRAIEKVRYLSLIDGLNLELKLSQLTFLSEKERKVLEDLFLTINQELVGSKMGMRQSSVRWVLVKTRTRLRKLVDLEWEKWFSHYFLIAFLEKNLSLRIMS